MKIEYTMSNAELRQAINDTLAAVKTTSNYRGEADANAEHLKALQAIERERAAQVVEVRDVELM